MLLQHLYVFNIHNVSYCIEQLMLKEGVNLDAPNHGMHEHYEKVTAAFLGRIQLEPKECLLTLNMTFARVGQPPLKPGRLDRLPFLLRSGFAPSAPPYSVLLRPTCAASVMFLESRNQILML